MAILLLCKGTPSHPPASPQSLPIAEHTDVKVRFSESGVQGQHSEVLSTLRTPHLTAPSPILSSSHFQAALVMNISLNAHASRSDWGLLHNPFTFPSYRNAQPVPERGSVRAFPPVPTSRNIFPNAYYARSEGVGSQICSTVHKPATICSLKPASIFRLSFLSPFTHITFTHPSMGFAGKL